MFGGWVVQFVCVYRLRLRPVFGYTNGLLIHLYKILFEVRVCALWPPHNSTGIGQKGLSDMVYTTGQPTVKAIERTSASVPMTI